MKVVVGGINGKSDVVRWCVGLGGKILKEWWVNLESNICCYFPSHIIIFLNPLPINTINILLYIYRKHK